MIYLKTIFTAESELLYVLAQIIELAPLVDRFIVVEPSFTHTGVERRLIGMDSILNSLGELSKKVDYIPLLDRAKIVDAANSETLAHLNEKITRGGFVDYYNLKGSDIVISTDGDEVLYLNSVIDIIGSPEFKINPFAAYTLRLNQFMYKDDLIAKDHSFYGPTIVKARRELIKGGYQNWRYVGRQLKEIHGCHFSWCLPVDDLVLKVKNFAHGPSYYSSDEAAKEVIMSDIQSMRYTFRKDPIKLSRVKGFDYPAGYVKALKLME